MMVVDVHLQARFIQDIHKLADSGGLPGVDQDEPRNLFYIDVAKPLETVNVDGRFYEIFAKGAFLRAGKNQQRVRDRAFWPQSSIPLRQSRRLCAW